MLVKPTPHFVATQIFWANCSRDALSSALCFKYNRRVRHKVSPVYGPVPQGGVVIRKAYLVFGTRNEVQNG
jgi:hypothetical protein